MISPVLFRSGVCRAYVNEMVDLFNRIDDASRSDLRLLNEQNALRFEAKLDHRTAELRAEIAQLGATLGARIETMDARIDARFSQQERSLETALHTHTRSMIAMWAIVIAMQVGLWLRGA